MNLPMLTTHEASGNVAVSRYKCETLVLQIDTVKMFDFVQMFLIEICRSLSVFLFQQLKRIN